MKIAINNDRIDIKLSTGGVYSITKENYVGAYEYMLTHATANEINSIRDWLDKLQVSFDAAVLAIREEFDSINRADDDLLVNLIEDIFKEY